MIPPLKPDGPRPLVFLSAACLRIIPAKAALAGALGGPATAGSSANPLAWPHHARSFGPTFGQALGRPAATPG